MKENINDLKKNAKDLEEILLGFDGSIQNISGQDVLPKLKAINPLNYDTVKKAADEQSTNIVESVILLYLPAEFIQQHDYIFQKMEVDKLTVSNLLFQMKTAEHALKKLLEEIDNGSTGARSFEVLASLQKSKMEIIKHLQSFMVTMENNYKTLKFDYYSNNVEKKTDSIDGSFEVAHEMVEEEAESKKFRGTKSLMAMVQGYVEETKKQKQNESDDTEPAE